MAPIPPRPAVPQSSLSQTISNMFTLASSDTQKTRLIKKAREVFKRLFEDDEDFRNGYQSNIAMLLHDKYGITDHAARNEAANDIMAVIFEAKEIKPVIGDPQEPITSRFDILDL